MVRESPSPVKGVRFRSLSLRSSWVQIPSPAPFLSSLRPARVVLAIKFRKKSTTYTRGCLEHSRQERGPATVRFRTCQRHARSGRFAWQSRYWAVRAAGSVDAECQPYCVWAPVCAPLWRPQPLKRLYYRYLPVVEHPYYSVPHLVQTPEEGVGCGLPDLAPFYLYGI